VPAQSDPWLSLPLTTATPVRTIVRVQQVLLVNAPTTDVAVPVNQGTYVAYQIFKSDLLFFCFANA
jgi:hypothetical protein